MEARRRLVVGALALVLLGGGGAAVYFGMRDTAAPRLDLVALSAKPAGVEPVNDPRLADRIGDLSLAEAAVIDGTTPEVVQASQFVQGYATWYGQLPGQVLIVELREHKTAEFAELSVHESTVTGPSGPSTTVTGVGTAKLHLQPPPPQNQGGAWTAFIRFARGRVSARLTMLTRATPTEAQISLLEKTAQEQYAKLPT